MVLPTQPYGPLNTITVRHILQLLEHDSLSVMQTVYEVNEGDCGASVSKLHAF